MICDFCNTPTDDAPERSYLGKPFVVPEIRYVDDGHFLACPECHRLIEAKDWDTLRTKVGTPDYVDLFRGSVGL